MNTFELVVKAAQRPLAPFHDVPLKDIDVACPHCTRPGSISTAECRDCGLIFAKWRKRAAWEAPRPSTPAPVRSARGWIWVAFAVALGLAVARGLPAGATFDRCGCELVDQR